MFTTGFTMNPEKVAEKMNGETIYWMQKMASKKQVAITGSFSDCSILELCKGQLTSGFKFCTDSTDQITAISNLTGGVNIGCN